MTTFNTLKPGEFFVWYGKVCIVIDIGDTKGFAALNDGIFCEMEDSQVAVTKVIL